MNPVYIVQQNAHLRVRNRRLQVEKEDETLQSIPLGQISQVVLFGNVGLTTPAIKALLARQVEVVFLTQKGEYRGRLTGGLTPHVPLRRAQYRRLDQPDFVLETAKGLVAAKLQHLAALLARHGRKRTDLDLQEPVAQVRAGLKKAPRKLQVSSLRGVEGSASAAYFRGFRQLFGPQWKFSRRARRPPPDPVNVLLSFGYTLLAQAAMGAVQTVGLDPYAGYLHEFVYNRPGAALDLMEEFRPVVDGVVLWCCNSGQLTPGDFTPGPASRPVVLGEAGKRRFLQAYEERMNRRFTHPARGQKLPMRQCILEQARQLARRVQNGPAGYRGMGFR